MALSRYLGASVYRDIVSGEAKPCYSFVCWKCLNEFHIIATLDNRLWGVTCPHCGGKILVRREGRDANIRRLRDE